MRSGVLAGSFGVTHSDKVAWHSVRSRLKVVGNPKNVLIRKEKVHVWELRIS